MKNSIFNLLFISSLIFLSSCSQKLSNHSEEDLESIESVMNHQVLAWNRGDIDSYMQGYWNNDSLLFTGGKSITSGWQQATDRYKKSYPTKADMGTLVFDDLKTTIISNKSAVSTGMWALKKDSNNVDGRFTLVWKKIRNEWRIIVDHSS